MGVISKEKIDNLYWLGRYIERAYTEIKEFIYYQDKMIDGKNDCYKEFCKKLGIKNVYKDSSDFQKNFIYDETNSLSIISCIIKAMDNAMILRETIGSETLSYLQLTLDEMKKASLKNEEASFLDLQKILDLILAFFGSIEDEVDDKRIRNALKSGKRLERLDLIIRIDNSSKDIIINNMKRLKFRLERSTLSYDIDVYNTLESIVLDDNYDKKNAISLVEKLVEI